tara:strand:- start:1213 stop:1443 length:231 start_codon:yes stop_codon:yes gene_type:complete
MEYCQVCEKHYKVINPNHLFSKTHLKKLRAIDDAIQHYKLVPEYNRDAIIKYQNILHKEVEKLENAGIVWKSKHST